MSLSHAFEAFATFGAPSTQGPVTMDNAHFAKLCRDARIVDKRVTSVDVDITFKQVLTKGARRITDAQFQQALKVLAAKKYGSNVSEADALQKISALVTQAAPVSNGTAADASGIFAKLTDTTKYTGAHRSRFDENGNGLGLAGRETHVRTANLSDMVDRSLSKPAAPQKRTVTLSMEEMNQQQQRSSAGQRVVKPASTPKKNAAFAAKSKVGSSSQSLAKPRQTNVSASANSLSAKSQGGSGNVYDRLTDSKQYTGTHKHRFDDTGKGRGLAGRDQPTSSQILRS